MKPWPGRSGWTRPSATTFSSSPGRWAGSQQLAARDVDAAVREVASDMMLLVEGLAVGSEADATVLGSDGWAADAVGRVALPYTSRWTAS